MNMRIHLSDPLPNSRLCLFSPLGEPVLAEPGAGQRAELASLASGKTARTYWTIEWDCFGPRWSARHLAAAGCRPPETPRVHDLCWPPMVGFRA